jgi:ribonuclease P protein component
MDFSAAYRTGKRRRCGAVTAVVADGPPGPATVGFVAGKKVGSAVRRNRAKRRLREAAAHSELKDDTVYVLIADIGVSDAPFPQLIEWINRCVREQTIPGDVR